MKKSKIILGLAYGDEGKGLTTAALAQQANQSLVIRFSGGHQAGHTVVLANGHRHVFSSFGSATLQGTPTYWSAYCTFSPIAFWNEARALQAAHCKPLFYLDALAPVTTPYDEFYNRRKEEQQQHGSCGMGIGATYERMETPYKLYAQDLQYPQVLSLKLEAIRQYYQQKTARPLPNWKEQEALFKKAVDLVLPQLQIVHEQRFFKEHFFKTYIFEGSQGILLDMDHGFFPHVTRAHTTAKQAMALIKRNELPHPELYYISRVYQTRHGNGPLSYEHLQPRLKARPHETNQYNEWQGHQRTSLLDVDMLNYALSCDANYHADCPKHLVLTCADQLLGHLEVCKDGKVLSFDNVKAFVPLLNTNFESVSLSYSDRSDELELQEKLIANI